jgi:hypothetical protein
MLGRLIAWLLRRRTNELECEMTIARLVPGSYGLPYLAAELLRQQRCREQPAPLYCMATHDRCYQEMRDGTCWYAPIDECEAR